MVDHLNVSYLYKKRGVYYFSKRVPCDVRSYYKSDRIVICLRTKSNVSAIRSSKSLIKSLMIIGHFPDGTKEAIMAVHTLSNGKIVKTESGATRID